jgi:hypothetical protein
MSLIARDTPRPFQPPVAQRDIKAEVIYCVGGVITRSLVDGGTQERQLAAQYRAWADRVSDRWPRTGALLRRMAASHEEWAHREDDESEHFGDHGT